MIDEFERFCNKYNINLNDQQAAAVQAVDGANLILAVPGSGKTTVLVARLGYMILCRNIPANQILAITYTKAAISDMKDRFARYFGKSLSEQVQFCTINSLSWKICHDYFGNNIPITIDDKKKKQIIMDILKGLMEDYPTDSDVIEAEKNITYVKNMILENKQIKNIDSSVDIINLMTEYKSQLKNSNYMDYDDQMLYAWRILKTYPDRLLYYQQKYRYICVDEAQDTSKLQHEIIRLLAKKYNNIFMVGDEDQSIYGFRGAFPQALMNFRNDYHNANILLMERNYRSTEEIVRISADFIDKNQNRYKKSIIAVRGQGEKVVRIPVGNRFEQYNFLINTIQQKGKSMTVLYRDNDCAVPLLDLFLRNNIIYNCYKTKFTFFTNRVTSDIYAFLKLALNPFDTESFMRIYYKCSLEFNKNTAQWTCNRSRRQNITVCSALKEQLRKWDKILKKAETFAFNMERISKMKTVDAIDFIYEKMYKKYLLNNNLDYGKIDIMKSLAKSEATISGFLNRLNELPLFIEKYSSDNENAVILSTVHSSKGLEYDTVYIMDTYDGMFPAISREETMESDENMNLYQEERRLFYVAMTRAKNKLFVFGIEDRITSFADEVLPIKKYEQSDINSQKSLSGYTKGIIKIAVDKAVVYEEEYSVGTDVCHSVFGNGIITEIIEIKNSSVGDYYTVKVEYNNGKTASYGLEIAVSEGYLKKAALA